jgi:hypothetical protein
MLIVGLMSPGLTTATYVFWPARPRFLPPKKIWICPELPAIHWRTSIATSGDRAGVV